MPIEIVALPYTPDTGNPAPSRVDEAWAAITGTPIAAIGLLILGLLTLIYLTRKAVKVARSERPDDPLSNLGMLIGFGWSSEAVWILTGPGGADLAMPIRITLFAILEVILGVFMIRAKRNVRETGRPGRAGLFAWLVAVGMSLVAVWTASNPGEAFLRLIVPLLLTSMWWDGLVGETGRRDAGLSSWRWTPRRLLLWLGALEPGERDVETVHRDRLTQQMTDLEFRRRAASGKALARVTRKLARLSLSADDEIIATVRERVNRASWFTVIPLPPVAVDADHDAGSEPITPRLARPVKKRVEVPPTRRTKPASRGATSGDAGDADPATQAARLVMTGQVDSIREAARQVPGASEATVRRRINAAGGAANDAAGDAPDLPISEPADAASARVNGNHPTLTGGPQ